ncbi:hypothetical protein LXL04_002505 [Taraxacum kok-saghyz]
MELPTGEENTKGWETFFKSDPERLWMNKAVDEQGWMNKAVDEQGWGPTSLIAGFKKVWGPALFGSFENSYIPENPRTPPISYISQTVIPFKKTDFGTLQNAPIKKIKKNFVFLSGFETKQKNCAHMHKKKFAHMQSFWKKKSFFRKKIFATGLIFERFLAPRSRFFEKVNGLGVLGKIILDTSIRKKCWDLLRTHIFPRPENSPNFLYLPNRYSFQKTDFGTLQNVFNHYNSLKKISEKTIFFLTFAYVQLFFIFCAYVQLFFCVFFQICFNKPL